MKKFIYSFIILNLFFIHIAQAKMVRYIDEEGDVHYVNPDFVKIPKRYLPQVKSQLKPPEKEQTENTNSENQADGAEPLDKNTPPRDTENQTKNFYIPPDVQNNKRAAGDQNNSNKSIGEPYYDEKASPPAKTQPTGAPPKFILQLFISENCPECDTLEQDLVSQNIRYKKYDIRSTSIGKRVYEKYGRKVPIVRIGGYTFYTTKINDILINLNASKK